MERVVKGVKFTLDESKPGPAYFILGVRKSGSSMFNRICKLLAKHNNYNFVDIAGSMFSNNVNAGMWLKDPALNDIMMGGNVYGGFRNFPVSIADNPIFTNGKKVLLIRDPRDALVSEYFSNAYSHSLPSAKAGDGSVRENLLRQREEALSKPIAEYVAQRANLMRKTLDEYKSLLKDRNTKIFKYEDIIFNKKELIQTVVAHFGWECKPRQLEAILGWVDVKPNQENPTQFIRKVTPGDHREKLDTSTIKQLDGELEPVLKTFGYA